MRERKKKKKEVHTELVLVDFSERDVILCERLQGEKEKVINNRSTHAHCQPLFTKPFQQHGSPIM